MKIEQEASHTSTQQSSEADSLIQNIAELKQLSDFLSYNHIRSNRKLLGRIIDLLRMLKYKLSYPRFINTTNYQKKSALVLDQIQGLIQTFSAKNQALEYEIFKVKHSLSENEKRHQATARESIRTKWSLIDELEKKQEASCEIKCNICDFKGTESDFQTVYATCIYGGGELKRFICPQCDVIFGPTKFTSQQKNIIDDDYTTHYIGYSESDCTQKEVRAFYLLNPKKGGVYLNYGCGCWAKSLRQIADAGYTVYGYDPYAGNTEDPYIISNKNDLQKMQFDGIFSNDLLEHLLNPVEELLFMRTILKDTSSKMAHSTACYYYKYEYTIFHAFFFLGKSVDIMCRKTGLQVLEKVDDLQANDFVCNIFGIADPTLDCLPLMSLDGKGIKDNKGITLYHNCVLFGPYIHLEAAPYKLYINCSFVAEGDVKPKMQIVTGRGTIGLMDFHLENGENIIPFCFDKHYSEIEFYMPNTVSDMIYISEIKLME